MTLSRCVDLHIRNSQGQDVLPFTGRMTVELTQHTELHPGNETNMDAPFSMQVHLQSHLMLRSVWPLQWRSWNYVTSLRREYQWNIYQENSEHQLWLLLDVIVLKTIEKLYTLYMYTYIHIPLHVHRQKDRKHIHTHMHSHATIISTSISRITYVVPYSISYMDIHYQHYSQHV